MKKKKEKKSKINREFLIQLDEVALILYLSYFFPFIGKVNKNLYMIHLIYIVSILLEVCP